MPSAPIVTWARILPLLAAVTPRSRYWKNERRPATSGAVLGVAWASFPGGVTSAGRGDFVVDSFIMLASPERACREVGVTPILLDRRRPGGRRRIRGISLPA